LAAEQRWGDHRNAGRGDDAVVPIQPTAIRQRDSAGRLCDADPNVGIESMMPSNGWWPAVSQRFYAVGERVRSRRRLRRDRTMASPTPSSSTREIGIRALERSECRCSD
jgi:hypothetical protein